MTSSSNQVSIGQIVSRVQRPGKSRPGFLQQVTKWRKQYRFFCIASISHCGRLEHVEVWSRQMGRTLTIIVFDQIVFCFKARLTFSLVIVDMCVDLSLTPGYLFCISRLLWGIPQGGRGMFWDKDQTALFLLSIFYIDFDLKVKTVNNCAIIYFVSEKRFCLQFHGNWIQQSCTVAFKLKAKLA